MSSQGSSPSHDEHRSRSIDRPHRRPCNDESGDRYHVDDPGLIVDQPAATRPDLSLVRNDTQPGSINHKARIFEQEEERRRSDATQTETENIPPEIVYHSAEWQPSYAVGGGTDLTRMLRPTSRRTFSWGGPGMTTIVRSPDSGSPSAPETGGEGNIRRRPRMGEARSSKMGEILRRRLEDGPASTYGLDRRVGSPRGDMSASGSEPVASPVSGKKASKRKEKSKGKLKDLTKRKERGKQNMSSRGAE